MSQAVDLKTELFRQGGPRHARPVSLKGRLMWALEKGPTRWTWKTNLVAVLLTIGVMVGLGVAVSVGLLLSFIDMKTL